MASKRVIIGFKTTNRSLKNSRSIMEIIVPDVEKQRILMGVPSSTAGDRETDDENEPINNAELLAIHEHGTIDGRLPARPLLEPVIKQEKTYIKKSFEKYISLMNDDEKEKASSVLDRLALYLQGKLVEYFDNNNWVPNAPSTIKRKGSAKPLINTGDLRRSIQAFVDEGGNSDVSI